MLKACGAQRSPDAASPDRFLKSREGNGAWGHIDKNERPDYGRIGFGLKSASVSSRTNTYSLHNPDTSLVRTASRGLVTRHKQVVMKNHSNL